MEKVIVTGAAGFIGFHLTKSLLQGGVEVVGLDNLNSYYDTTLKIDRLKALSNYDGFRFIKLDISNSDEVKKIMAAQTPECVVHLAAQAGVRYSIENPFVYGESNLLGFLSILEGCRHINVPHLVYASSSSIYGANSQIPFSVDDRTDNPVSLYAATKKANELMAHSYSHLFGLQTTGLRFFTVYGPWGRPDMALFRFTKAILEGSPIEVYNHGKMSRDFTYIDDAIEITMRILDHIPQQRSGKRDDASAPGNSSDLYRVFNVACGIPVKLGRFIEIIESELGRQANKTLLPMQPGDVESTYADVTGLAGLIGNLPRTKIEIGIANSVKWYRDYYNI